MNKPRSNRKKPAYQPDTKPDNDKRSETKKPRYNRIKTVLSDLDISNKELANRLGVTEGTVSTWCRNFKQPKIETLFEIAKALEVEPGTLLNTIKKADV